MDTKAREVARSWIDRLGLDLSELVVFTEAASGPYLHTPLVAALAGAERVVAVTADTRYGGREDIARETLAEAEAWGLRDRLEVVFEKDPVALAKADIVTNSGHVRPIDRELIAALKPTAVVPLMWETWEFRASEIDLETCREHGVLVLGTRETEPPCDMRPFMGRLGLRLLSELGVEPRGAQVALLGSQPLIGGAIASALRDAGAELDWYAGEADDESTPVEAKPYGELGAHLKASTVDLAAMIVAEHRDPRPLIGPAGIVSATGLAAANPEMRIGVIAGNVDGDELAASGLRHAPGVIRAFGEMSYQPAELGHDPVLMLYASGLRVGEAMARARLGGADPRESAREAIASSPAMDFDGEFAWL